MSAATVSPIRGYGDRHAVAPRRGAHLFDVLALVVILAGDAVAFQQIAAVAMPNSQDPVVWALVVALSLAATVSMHHAGAAARTRAAHGVHPGLVWSWWLVVAWACLGGVALWFRLEHAAGGTPSGGGGGFAAVAAPPPELPLAVLLLMLYLVGGATAYGIGYKTHNPARNAYQRALRAYLRARRGYQWALWRRDRAFSARSLTASGEIAESPAADPAAEEWPDEGQVAKPQVPEPAPADELAIRRERAEKRAEAQAEQLRQLARHQLAIALGDPASSSGVFSTRELGA